MIDLLLHTINMAMLYFMYSMVVLGLPITIYEDIQGNQRRVVDGQTAMLLAIIVLIWFAP